MIPSSVRGNAERIAAALTDIASGLQVDGYDLVVVDVDADHLDLKITATPEACDDCLVPTAVMQAIVSGALDGAYSAHEISVGYPAGSH